MLLNPLINVARTHEFSILNKTDLYSKLIILNDSIKFLTFYENDPGLSLMFKKNIILAEFDLSYYENKNKKKMKEVIKSIKSSQITDKKIDNLFDKINKNKTSTYSYSTSKVERKLLEFKKVQSNINYRLEMIFFRFDVVSTQRFLINEYLKGNSGDSLKQFWYIFVPRILWKSKPIIGGEGIALHNTFYNNNKFKKGSPGYQNSSLAPSFHIEAFWNYGLSGLIIISLFYGIVVSVFSNIALNINKNKIFLSYLIVFIPLVKIISFYEGWIVLSLVGELVILIALFFFCFNIIKY